MPSPLDSLKVYALPGVCTAIGDVYGGIDSGLLRIINAQPTAMSLAGVVDECYNCRLPALADKPLQPGAAFSQQMTTAYGFTLSTGAGPNIHLAAFDEHSSNTIIFHANGGYTTYVDAPGRIYTLPIAWAAIILIAVAVALRAARAAAYAWGARAVKRGDAPPPVAPDSRRPVTLMSFFALDSAAAQGAADWLDSRNGNAASGDDDGLNSLLQDDRYAEPRANKRMLGSLQDSDQPKAAKAAAPSSRLLSIDAFRGVALCIMMFVNADGGKYAFFDHSKWNGLTVADLVFPWFVFLSGVSTALSVDKERRSGATALTLASHAVQRAAKLVILGFIINGSNYLPDFRVFSVLGYFAFANLTVRLVDLALPPFPSKLTSSEKTPDLAQGLFAGLYADIGRYASQWLVMLMIGGVYLFLERALPVPGCPTGYVGAGGLADQGAYQKCTGGAHRLVDVTLFTATHVYSHPTCTDVYQCGPYDPEGALGALMAAWMAFLGLHAGRMIVRQRAAAGGVGASFKAFAAPLTMNLVATGLILCTIAGFLCGWSKEGGWDPVNKNRWSPSFILLLSGWGHIVLSVFFNVCDAYALWDGSPFRAMGGNGLPIYLTSELLSDSVLFKFWFTSEQGAVSHAEVLTSNITVVLLLLSLARVWQLQKWSWNV